MDIIKIDRAFVSAATTGGTSSVLARAIVGLGRSLQVAVLGEGIETTDQAAGLLADGCEYGQGFYFGRPMPAEAFRRLLAVQAELVRAVSPDPDVPQRPARKDAHEPETQRALVEAPR